MSTVNLHRHLAVKVYAVWGALLVATFLPAALARIGSVRTEPVRFDSIPGADGAVAGTVLADGRRHIFAAVSVAGGDWTPAGGVVARRTLAYVPAGTAVDYRTTGGALIRGTVSEQPASPAALARSATLALLAGVLSLTGAGLALSGVTRATVFAGGALAGLGHISGAFFLEANATLAGDPALRSAVVLAWTAFPRHLAFFWLASFLAAFPADLSRGIVSRVSRAVLGAFALAQWALIGLFHVPGLLERLPFPAQSVVVGGARVQARLIFAAGLLAALALVAAQALEFRRGRLPAGTRRRAAVVGAGLLVGLVPPLLLSLAQLISIALRGRPLLSSVVMVLSFLPVLIVPAALTYAMLAPRVVTVGILVRRVVLLAFAERSIRLLSFAPVAAAGLHLYRKRGSPLGEVLGEHPVLFGLALLATVLGLRYGERTGPLLARFLFRARGASTTALARISEDVRQARDVGELAEQLSNGVERTLGVEQACLFVRSERTGSFAAPGRPLPVLAPPSAVLDAAGVRSGPFRVDPDAGNELWLGFPELDRGWLDSTRTHLLVPLKGSGGRLLGFIAVGEKLSELPLEAEEEQLLAAVASSGALALENFVLRSSQPPASDASRTVEVDERAEGGDAGTALLCRRCHRILPSAAGGSCPDDETLLEVAPVPLLLAGKYRFERRIGAGGMGVVYLARDLALARDVAIKTLPSLSPGSARRLQREARAAALLVHPNLGLIFSSERWRGTPMLVLEYLSGGTLAARIRSGPVPVARAVAWGAALASGLEALHARGVLHRDIKPSNVGFTAEGTVKLLDFGLVRLLDEAGTGTPADPLPASGASGAGESTPLTSASHVVGTVPYLSPEALQGNPPSAAFDLWGLSLTIYEAVTGLNPFHAASKARITERILSRPVPDPRSLRPDCPAPVAELLLAALARSPSERPSSARALREAFEAAGRSIPTAGPDAEIDPVPSRPSDAELLRTPTVEP